jgi:hypothetical protein
VCSTLFSKKLKKRLCLGASIKWIESKIEEEGADTFCFDVGARFDTPHLSFGVVLQNQGNGLKFIEEKSSLPSLIRCGVGTYLTKNFMIMADVVFPRYGKRNIFAGGELFLKNISLRAGYKDASELEKGICLGTGLFSKRWALDIGFSPTEELGNTYYISFSLRLR